MALQRHKDEFAELRTALERRLRQQQLKAATLGVNTPSEIITEIEDYERKLAELDVAEKVINGGAVSEEVLKVLRQLAPNDVVIKTQFVQQMELRDLRKELIDGLASRREETAEAIEEVKGEVGKVRDQVGVLSVEMGKLSVRMASLRTLTLALLLSMVLGGCTTWAILIYLLVQRTGG